MRPVEQQVRNLLRAWPIPDRAERGDEIVGTTLDLMPEGVNRVPVALAVNLVVGGLRARWRMRPPAWRWLYYRLGGRLPVRWHRWLLNDLNGPGWRRRILVSKLILGPIALAVAYAFSQTEFDHTRPSIIALWLILFFGFAAGSLVPYRSRTVEERNRRLVRSVGDQVRQSSKPSISVPPAGHRESERQIPPPL